MELNDDGNYINDELKYGAGHQSIDSNPVESQSEWSDDECREEATGKTLSGISRVQFLI